MPRVLCTLPYASEKINGVRFASVPKGMLSEDISEERAEGFAAIPGYEIVGRADQEAPKVAADAGLTNLVMEDDGYRNLMTPVKRKMGRPPKPAADIMPDPAPSIIFAPLAGSDTPTAS